MTPYEKAQQTALLLLARRPHASGELRRKLLARGVEASDVESILSECRRLNYLDDEGAAESYVAELLRKGVGPDYIREALRQRGFEPEQIRHAMARLACEANEAVVAGVALEKKRSALLREPDMRKRKEKAARFLQSRGFHAYVIGALLRKRPDLLTEVDDEGVTPSHPEEGP